MGGVSGYQAFGKSMGMAFLCIEERNMPGTCNLNPTLRAVPVIDNYVGSYRRNFVLPAGWNKEQVYLHVGSACSNLQVWINGKFVGYSEDNKMAAEFDITKYLTPGENKIAMQIMRWCDGTYLEDQDYWRLSGISRETYLYMRPSAHG